MFDFDALIACFFAAAVLGYVLFVNRRLQRYSGRFVLNVPIETAWDLLALTPGTNKAWLPPLRSTEWTDEGTGELVSRFDGGHECYTRLIVSDPPTREECLSTYRWQGASRLGDVIHGSMTLQTVPEGTEVKLAYIIERKHLATGLVRRLGYPMLISTVSRLVRGYLAQQKTGMKTPPAASRLGAGNRLSRQIALAALSLAAMAYIFDFSIALAILVTIAVHEYGHVWSLRRHGQEARFYLIPFFGGMAMGNRSYVSDAEAAEVTLMGPAFGLLPPLAFLAIFSFTAESRWLVAGFVSLTVNGFNLLPIPPLDGGRLVQTLLKPLGSKVWFAASGLLILFGAGLALMMKSKALLALLAVTAILWSASPKPMDGIRPLKLHEGSLALGAYLGLIAIHLMAVWWCDWKVDGRLLRAFGVW